MERRIGGNQEINESPLGQKKDNKMNDFNNLGRYNRAIRDKSYNGYIYGYGHSLGFQLKIIQGIKNLSKEWAIKNNIDENQFDYACDCEYLIIIENNIVKNFIIFPYNSSWDYEYILKLCDKNIHWIAFNLPQTADHFYEWKNIDQSTMEILINKSFNDSDFICGAHHSHYKKMEANGFNICACEQKFPFCSNSGIKLGI